MNPKYRFERGTLASVLAIAGMAIPVGCAPAPTDTSVDMVRLVVQPRSVELQQGQAQAFRANGITASGDTVLLSADWQASGGSIDPSGRFTAPLQDGHFTVIASDPVRGWLSDTVEVDVGPPGAPVASVVVTPTSITLVPGDSVEATAQTLDSAGVVLNGRTLVWASSDSTVATVGANGTIVAVAEGATTVTASSEGRSGAVSVTVTDVAVASVSVTPSLDTLEAGTTLQFSVELLDGSGNVLSGRTVSWTSSDESVATVDGTGLLTGLDAGTATVTASSGGASGTAAIVVLPATITAVRVIPASAIISTGNSAQLSARPMDAAGNHLQGRAISWASDDPAIADVDANGVVLGNAPGSVTVTATSEGVDGTASVTIVTVPVVGVTVTPGTAVAVTGDSVQLTAVLVDGLGNQLLGRVVAWSSGDPSVAVVNGTGNVVGISSGTATITATSEGVTGTSTITITLAPVASVTVAPGTASVIVGNDVQLTASPEDASGNPLLGRVVTWASSDASIVIVNATGLVTGIAEGSATITATSEGKTGTATITVHPTPVASVSVTPGAASVNTGSSVQLTATPRDASGNPLLGRAVAWSSSDVAVATVTSGGLVTGVTPGTVTITATSEGKSGSSTVTVTNIPVASVDVTPSNASIDVGNTTQLAATPKDAGGNPLSGRTVTWSSSNAAVATVNGNGLVTGVTAGSVTITATSEGQSGTASVQVNLGQQNVYFQEAFEDTNFSSRGWYDNAGIRITSAEAHSGSSSLEWDFTQGSTTPVGGGIRHLFTETETVHFSYWVKYSANWVGSGQNAHPHEFYLLTNLDPAFKGPAWTHTTLYVEHNYQQGGTPWVRAKDGMNIDTNNVNVDLTGVTENRSAHGCNGDGDSHPSQCFFSGGVWSNGKNWSPGQPYFTETPGSAGYKNDWHHVEVTVRLNSIQGGIGMPDGVVQYWFDGQLIIDHRDVLFRTGANAGMRFNQLIVGPYIGAGSPANQKAWIDDLSVASQR